MEVILEVILEVIFEVILEVIFDRDKRSSRGPRSGYGWGILSQTEHCSAL